MPLALNFLLVLVVVVYFSVKLSDKTEWFEKNTNLKGVVIGLILAFATSLPELISGLTAIYINETELATASILGSNIFNFVIISIAFLTVFSQLPFLKVQRKTNSINLFLIAIYSFFIIGYYFYVNEIFTINSLGISIVSIFIVIAYSLSIITLNKDDNDDSGTITPAPKNEIQKNLFISIVFIVIIIYASTQLTNVAEKIMISSGLSASLIGSILIGASTSLPEAVSAISLMKKRLFDVGAASVLGSNLFNFLILAILDVFEKENILKFVSPNTFFLVLIGLFFSILMYVSFIFVKSKNKIAHLITPILVISTYLIYLIS